MSDFKCHDLEVTWSNPYDIEYTCKSWGFKEVVLDCDNAYASQLMKLTDCPGKKLTRTQ